MNSQSPPSGIIHLTRNPCAYVLSCRKNDNSNIDKSIEEYSLYHSKIIRIKNTININYFTIQYEDILKSAKEILSRILSFINVSNENLFHPIHSDIHWMGNSSMFKFDGTIYENKKWMTELSQNEIDYINLRTASLRKILGY